MMTPKHASCAAQIRSSSAIRTTQCHSYNRSWHLDTNYCVLQRRYRAGAVPVGAQTGRRGAGDLAAGVPSPLGERSTGSLNRIWRARSRRSRCFGRQVLASRAGAGEPLDQPSSNGEMGNTEYGFGKVGRTSYGYWN